jgi:hypothetical protein
MMPRFRNVKQNKNQKKKRIAIRRQRRLRVVSVFLTLQVLLVRSAESMVWAYASRYNGLIAIPSNSQQVNKNDASRYNGLIAIPSNSQQVNKNDASRYSGLIAIPSNSQQVNKNDGRMQPLQGKSGEERERTWSSGTDVTTLDCIAPSMTPVCTSMSSKFDSNLSMIAVICSVCAKVYGYGVVCIMAPILSQWKRGLSWQGKEGGAKPNDRQHVICVSY